MGSMGAGHTDTRRETRDGFRESISRKFTMGRKFSKHPSGSHIFGHFVQKHKTNYFKTSLIQILWVNTGCAKLF